MIEIVVAIVWFVAWFGGCWLIGYGVSALDTFIGPLTWTDRMIFGGGGGCAWGVVMSAMLP